MSLLLPWQLPPEEAGDDRDFTATWEQAPATWDATVAESFNSTASFVQEAASWAGVTTEEFPASATWIQAAATWDANVSFPEPVTGTATWVQAAASWQANITGPQRDEGIVALFRDRQLHPPRKFRGVFLQEPAGWKAEMETNDDDLAIAFLLGAFDRRV